MSYGLEVYNSVGQKVISSNTQSFCIIDDFIATTAGSKSYPQFAGGAIHPLIYSNVTLPIINSIPTPVRSPVLTSVDYSLGYPVLSWSPDPATNWSNINWTGYTSRYQVALTSIPTVGFGAQFINDQNELVISEKTITDVYIGEATRVRTYCTGWQMGCDPGSGTMHVYQINSTNPPIAFVQMLPNQYACVASIALVSTNTYEIWIIVSETNRAVPRVLCFADITTGGNTNHGISVYNGSGQVIFDSTQKPLAPVAYVTTLRPPTNTQLQSGSAFFFNWPGVSSPATVVGTLPTNAAISSSVSSGIANWRENSFSGAFKTATAAANRSGNDIRYGWAITSVSLFLYRINEVSAYTPRRHYIIDMEHYL
jgi:hypothetical protein